MSIDEVVTGSSTNPYSNFQELKRGTRDVMQKFGSPTEMETQMKAVTPFLEFLGWARLSSRVRLEYSIDDETDQRPDYMLLDSAGEPKIAVEVKSWKSKLGRAERNQIKTYIRIYNLRFGILTNGFHYRFYIRPDTDQIEISDPISCSLQTLAGDEQFLEHFQPTNPGTGRAASESLERILREGTVQAFVTNLLAESSEDKISKQTVWEVFQNYAEQNSADIPQRGAFWRKLYSCGVSKSDVRRTRIFEDSTNRHRILEGYRFTEDAIPYLDDKHRDYQHICEMLEL